MSQKRLTNGKRKTMTASKGPIEAFAGSLRAERARLEISQDDLATRAGISRFSIIRIEAGESDGLKIDTAHRLAKALGVSLTSMLGGA